MSRKGAPSLDDLSAVIADLHDAGVGGAEWPTALARLDGLFDSYAATVWMQDPSGRFHNVHAHMRSAESTADYFEYYGRLDTLRPSVMRGSVGTILTNEMVIPRSEFVRTEFYADFANRYDMHDCIQGHVFDSFGYSGYVSMTRPKRFGAFEQEDVCLLRLLMPHLRRVMEVELRLAVLDAQRDSMLEVLDRLRHGVLMVDAQARVTYLNGVADAILRKGDGLGTEPASQMLRASAPGQTGALRRLITQAASRGGAGAPGMDGSGALRLDRSTGVPLLLTVAPLKAGMARTVSSRAAALILIAMPESEEAPAPTQLRALYGLTAAEVAVAGRIAQGQGVKNAAEALVVLPSTLRWHLQRVFEKTGTTRQAELARLVERVRAISGSDRG